MSPNPPRLELGSSDLAAAVELAGGDLGWTIEDVADLFLEDGLAAEDADPSPPPQNFQEVVCAKVKSLGCTVFADMLGALDGSRIVTVPPPLKRLVVFVPSDEALAAQPAALKAKHGSTLCKSHMAHVDAKGATHGTVVHLDGTERPVTINHDATVATIATIAGVTVHSWTACEHFTLARVDQVLPALFFHSEIAPEQVWLKHLTPAPGLTILGASPTDRGLTMGVELFYDHSKKPVTPKEMTDEFGGGPVVIEDTTVAGTVVDHTGKKNARAFLYDPKTGKPMAQGSTTSLCVPPFTAEHKDAAKQAQTEGIRKAEFYSNSMKYCRIAHAPPKQNLLTRALNDIRKRMKKELVRAPTQEELDAVRFALCPSGAGTRDNRYYIVFSLKAADGTVLGMRNTESFLLLNSAHTTSEKVREVRKDLNPVKKIAERGPKLEEHNEASGSERAVSPESLPLVPTSSSGTTHGHRVPRRTPLTLTLRTSVGPVAGSVVWISCPGPQLNPEQPPQVLFGNNVATVLKLKASVNSDGSYFNMLEVDAPRCELPPGAKELPVQVRVKTEAEEALAPFTYQANEVRKRKAAASSVTPGPAKSVKAQQPVVGDGALSLAMRDTDTFTEEALSMINPDSFLTFDTEMGDQSEGPASSSTSPDAPAASSASDAFAYRSLQAAASAAPALPEGAPEGAEVLDDDDDDELPSYRSMCSARPPAVPIVDDAVCDDDEEEEEPIMYKSMRGVLPPAVPIVNAAVCDDDDDDEEEEEPSYRSMRQIPTQAAVLASQLQAASALAPGSMLSPKPSAPARMENVENLGPQAASPSRAASKDDADPTSAAAITSREILARRHPATGFTILHYLAGLGQNAALARLLALPHCPLEAVSLEGLTPLDVALLRGQRVAARMLDRARDLRRLPPAEAKAWMQAQATPPRAAAAHSSKAAQQLSDAADAMHTTLKQLSVGH